MYNFLDKIGLKAVLEAIKGNIPSSLPANGGNADTVDDYHVSDVIYSSAIKPPQYFTDVARINPETKRIERWNTVNIKVALADRATNAENANTVNGHAIMPIKSEEFTASTDPWSHIQLFSSSENKKPLAVAFVNTPRMYSVFFS